MVWLVYSSCWSCYLRRVLSSSHCVRLYSVHYCEQLRISLMSSLRRSKDISKSTKIHLYTSVVIPSAIYASETWRTTDKTNRMLNVFKRRCLRDIMRVSWKDHMTNEELLLRASIGDLQDIVATRRRRFIGHVLHLPTSRPASLVIDWTPEGGCRRWGRPMRTWRDMFMEDTRAMGVSGSGTHDEIRSVASDRA